MQWLFEMFGQSKPIIGMCHFKPLPGDPEYDESTGVEFVIDQARADLIALQNGGVDAIMFSNEGSLPYLTRVESITVSCMARIIGELLSEITIPFGVNVLWDPKASIDLAVATGARFVREIFTGDMRAILVFGIQIRVRSPVIGGDWGGKESACFSILYPNRQCT
jgi:membrane complex biogenesis BtpA family protein